MRLSEVVAPMEWLDRIIGMQSSGLDGVFWRMVDAAVAGV